MKSNVPKNRADKTPKAFKPTPASSAAPKAAQRPKLNNAAVKQAAGELRAENTPEHFNALINLMMRGAFLAPAQIELNGEAPRMDQNGRLQLPKNTKITFALVKSGDGKSYFTAFTDETELNLWKNRPQGQVMVLRFDDYARMLAGNDRAAGFVLNPFSDNLRFSSQMVSDLLKQRNEQLKKARQAAAQRAVIQNAQIKPGDKVTIVEPSVYPDGLVDPLCAALEQYPMVGAAYLQIMVINGSQKSYLLVLDAPKDDALFRASAQAAQAFLQEKQMNMNITTSASSLGQQGMRGSEPFYRKGRGRVDNLDDEGDESGEEEQ